MADTLSRIQKKIVGDGPAERQILLMKLMHEFESAPDFGDKYISDASSPPQQWIARVGALLAKAGIEHKCEFQSAKRTSVQFWGVAREPMRQIILAAAEEIKLELELDGQEEIGKVYDAKHQYDFLRDFNEILTGAHQEIFVVDPYFDGDAFDTYLSGIVDSCNIRILGGKYSGNVAGRIEAYKAQFGKAPKLRKSKEIHDRLVILDKTDCWIVGGSIKDAGKKPTYLVPLQPNVAPAKIEIYEALWNRAQEV